MTPSNVVFSSDGPDAFLVLFSGDVIVSPSRPVADAQHCLRRPRLRNLPLFAAHHFEGRRIRVAQDRLVCLGQSLLSLLADFHWFVSDRLAHFGFKV